MDDPFYFKLVESPVGWIGFGGSQKGLRRVHLPEKSKAETKRGLLKGFENTITEEAKIPWMSRLEEQLQRFFLRGSHSFKAIPLDFKVTEFQNKVYQFLRDSPDKKVFTYKEIAVGIGSPNSSRAIGMAMGKNPTPLVIPCHRVIASNGGLGGFSAFGGLTLKKRLLSYEDIEIEKCFP